MAVLYKMFSCQGGLNWIYGECTVTNVLLSRWFDLVRHGYGTLTYNGQIQGLKTMDGSSPLFFWMRLDKQE